MKIKPAYIIKLTALGVSSFSIAMILTVVVLTSLPITLWQGFDASSLKSLAGRVPRLYIVQSGSMEPAIKTGSVVVSLPKENYVAGDVITFAQKNNSKNLITHRIVFKNFPNGVDGSPSYVTAGDANEDFDSAEVTGEQIVGKSVLSIPYLGYLANFAKTPYGFIFLVIVPATIIIYEEFKFLLREIKKIFSKIFSLRFRGRAFNAKRVFSLTKDHTITDKPVSNVNKRSFSYRSLSIFIPVFGASMVFAGLASSYFSDTEKSVGNVFSAAADFGTSTLTPTPTDTPTPGRIVINEVYYDVDSDHLQPANADENDFEWVELYNAGGTTVNIKDWKITDNSGTERTISTSNRDIAPGQFAVLAKAANTFVQWTIPAEAHEIPLGEIFGNGLANGGDIVILKDASGTLIDQVSYDSNTTAFSPSVPGVTEGHSIERNPDGIDTDTATDFIDMATPSPGS